MNIKIIFSDKEYRLLENTMKALELANGLLNDVLVGCQVN